MKKLIKFSFVGVHNVHMQAIAKLHTFVHNILECTLVVHLINFSQSGVRFEIH